MEDVKIENNGITINLDISQVLRGLSEEDLEHLIEDLSCEDRIIKNVADQIVHGCTDKGWSGGQTFEIEPSTPLDKAKRFVAEHASDVAKDQIDSLTRDLKRKEEKNRELWKEIHKLRDKLDNRIRV